MNQISCFYGHHRASAINYYQPTHKTFMVLNLKFQEKKQLIAPKKSETYLVIKRAFQKNETLFIHKKVWKR